jgi:hypothetical protein
MDSDLALIKLEKGTQPILLDLNGDLYMDVLYQTSDALMVALGSAVPTVFESKSFFDSYLDTTCA